MEVNNTHLLLISNVYFFAILHNFPSPSLLPALLLPLVTPPLLWPVHYKNVAMQEMGLETVNHAVVSTLHNHTHTLIIYLVVGYVVVWEMWLAYLIK